MGTKSSHFGANRDRTGDLLHAMQALSQLSYSPKNRILLREERFYEAGIALSINNLSLNKGVHNVAWTRFLCPGWLHTYASRYNKPGHEKRVQAT